MKFYFPVSHVKSEVEFSLKKIDPQLGELHSAVTELLQFSGELALFNAHRLAPNYPNAERNVEYILERLDIVLHYKRTAQEQWFKKIMQTEIYDKLTGALPNKIFRTKELSLSEDEAQKRLRSASPISQSSSAIILKKTGGSSAVAAAAQATAPAPAPVIARSVAPKTKPADPMKMYTASPFEIVEHAFAI